MKDYHCSIKNEAILIGLIKAWAEFGYDLTDSVKFIGMTNL